MLCSKHSDSITCLLQCWMYVCRFFLSFSLLILIVIYIQSKVTLAYLPKRNCHNKRFRHILNYYICCERSRLVKEKRWAHTHNVLRCLLVLLSKQIHEKSLPFFSTFFTKSNWNSKLKINENSISVGMVFFRGAFQAIVVFVSQSNGNLFNKFYFESSALYV